MGQLSLDYSMADAIALGVRAFGFLSGDSAFVHRMLAGRQRAQLSHLLSNPKFLAGVLDALIADETALAYFVGTVGVTIATPYEARRLLNAAG
jgi:hypothetical protein